MANVPFPNLEEDPNYGFLNARLNQIKKVVFGEQNVTEYEGRYRRLAINADFGWISQINSGPAKLAEKPFIDISLHVGDTKGQGAIFFERNPDGFKWPRTIKQFELIARPYLKVSNAYGSALLWICPTSNESLQTHTRDFFNQFAGRWSREKWDDFENSISKYIDDWKNKCVLRGGQEIEGVGLWDPELTETNRTSFLLSVGTHLRIMIPYGKCQELDDDISTPTLVTTFRDIIQELRNLIDGH